MDRRFFAKNIAVSAVALGACGTASFAAADQRPQIAITIDDFIVDDTPALSGAARNRSMLDALRHEVV